MSEEQLGHEFLGNASPMLMVPQESTESNSSPSNHSSMNKISSAVYSGPTINVGSQPEELSQARIQMVEGGLSKDYEHKYTLRIKSCGNAMADDGYKWRKYGQKTIKNSPYPRSYYRCTNPRCGAKKQVERWSNDPDTLVITYEGLHLHYIYPFFVLDEPNQNQSDPPLKKLKKSISDKAQQVEESPENDKLSTLDEEMMNSSQGLLEDMVPLTIRKPFMNSTNYSSSSSYSSTPSSPSIFSWSPIQYSPLDFDVSLYESISQVFEG